MKKCSILVMLCMLLLVSACGKSSDSGSTAAPSATTGAGAAQQQITLKVYTNAKGNPDEQMIKIIDAFNKQGGNIKVEHVALVQNNDAREMLQKLDVLSASGEQVDVVLLTNEGFVQERAGNGMLYPLDEFYKAKNINPKEEYFRNPMYNGHYYGAMTDAGFWFVALNENHLKAAGLPVPGFDWTWDDFRTYAKKLKESGGKDRFGAYFHTFGEYANIIAYTDFQNPQLKEDGKLQFDHPTFEYWFNMRRAMEKEDKSVKPHADVLASKQNWPTDFMKGTTSMMPIATYALDEAFTNKNTFPRDFKITFAPLPRSSKDTATGLTNIGGSFLTIAKNSKNKEAAFEFIHFATMKGAEFVGRIPGWKKADCKSILTKFLGDKTDLIDINALSSVQFDSRVRTPEPSAVSVPYQQQLKKVAEAGINKFLLDDVPFEEAKKYMMTEGQKIIDSNKK